MVLDQTEHQVVSHHLDEVDGADVEDRADDGLLRVGVLNGVFVDGDLLDGRIITFKRLWTC